MSDLPPEPPPPPPPPTEPAHADQSLPVQTYDSDLSNLNALSIFYYILAGLQLIGGFFPLIYVGCGTVMGLFGMASANRPEDAAAGAGISAFFVCLGLPLLALLWTLAFLNFLAARSLKAHKRLTLCYAMAVIACLHFPLGTILGVFTLVVLSKPGVKAHFT